MGVEDHAPLFFAKQPKTSQENVCLYKTIPRSTSHNKQWKHLVINSHNKQRKHPSYPAQHLPPDTATTSESGGESRSAELRDRTWWNCVDLDLYVYFLDK